MLVLYFAYALYAPVALASPYFLTPGYYPPIYPKPPTACSLTITQCEGIGFVNPDLLGKASMTCRVALAEGCNCTAFTAELVTGNRHTAMGTWDKYMLPRGGEAAHVSAAVRDMPAGDYEVRVAVQYQDAAGEAHTMTAKRPVTLP